jgi:hypothetical protein
VSIYGEKLLKIIRIFLLLTRARYEWCWGYEVGEFGVRIDLGTSRASGCQYLLDAV